MAGYIGTKAVSLSTTAADVTGDAEIGGDLTVSGALTSTGIDDNATSTAITIDSSENVGIGTSSPNKLMHLKANSPVINLHSDNASFAQISFTNSGGVSEQGFIKYEHDGDFAGSMQFRTSGSERMRITSSGDIQVSDRDATISWPDGSDVSSTLLGAANHPTAGYTSPAHSYWNLVSSKGGTHVVLNTDGSRTNSANAHDHFTVWQKSYDQTNGRLAFSVNNGGEALFGSAGVSIDRNWNNYPSITVRNDSANGNDNTALNELRVHGSNASTASWWGGSTGIDFAVNLRIDGATYISSDRRKKTDVTDIIGALDTVKSLEGKRYQILNSDGSVFSEASETGYKFGFLAQDVQSVIPEAVRYYPDEDDGTEGYNNAYAVDYASLVPLLVNAIKEQQAKIDDLETRLTALEGN